ncbi:MAG: TrkH family potassium uptake protein [Lachnospiraceae bacterium]|nr:TrkH family potassium uptake protein [Lachnospiraceae bacterium]
MNYPMIRYILSHTLRLEAALMLLPCIFSVIFHESEGLYYIATAAICLMVSVALSSSKPKNFEVYNKDGFVAVALCWLAISALGAVPFVMTKEIPNYINALFEIVSGFTTTGASILFNVEGLSHTSLFWRSFSHWIGGMGVLVFLLILMPVKTGSRMNLMKAESPGPSVSKFVPRVRENARILYQIYLVLTVCELILLLITRMNWFDALCISVGTAGTGGFGVLNSSCGDYTAVQQWIITVFMIAFGINFSFYYLILCKKVKVAVKMQEVRGYLLIIFSAIVLLVWNNRGLFPGLGENVRAAAFQVGSIITTTGFSTVDFNQWPELSKMILLVLMLIGACAGSTGGGMKVSRIILMLKSVRKEVQSIAHPRSVKKIKMDGQVVEDEVLRTLNVFIITYLIIFGISLLIISFDEFTLETNFSAVAATLNNIGPGLGLVGPTSNYIFFSPISKIVLIFDMLAGRLELFPMLLLMLPSTWKTK